MEPEGVFADVKPFAVHDGPGIRTTLFLKGCPLRCVWCHNPETIRREPELAFFASKCLSCGKCAGACSRHRFENRVHTVDRNGCTACGECVKRCPAGALRIYGERISVPEAFRLLTADRMFYETSATTESTPRWIPAAMCRGAISSGSCRGRTCSSSISKRSIPACTGNAPERTTGRYWRTCAGWMPAEFRSKSGCRSCPAGTMPRTTSGKPGNSSLPCGARRFRSGSWPVTISPGANTRQSAGRIRCRARRRRSSPPPHFSGAIRCGS